VPINLMNTTPANSAVPILELEVGEIHLDLLGLNVDTSKICLEIAAQPGSGNLLGNLLVGVANLLNAPGATPGGVLSGLSSANLTGLTTAITDLLNGVLGAVTSPTALKGVNGSGGPLAAAATTTNILNLSLGPVDLNLLGLTVSLDNCEGGPVTVDITAEAGQGKLLGNLLTGLTRLLDNGANGNAIANSLDRIAGAIRNLI
jgi:hypothetical protein